ncbi:MAG: aminotransferase class I/II-fold pyridoxal phosphate-dependent enzyme, partial [Lentisphaeria bacterium]|nr:aminotransferase class I/II-fold pyridoxal phosphate-dependent enzyme [Lentisphaeria bacterium]
MNGNICALSRGELEALKTELDQAYAAFRSRGVKLDMSRGKPSPDQLDVCNPILTEPFSFKAENGMDGRNYGGLDGLPEMKRYFGELLGIDPARIVIGGNASLTLMYDMMMRLYVFGVGGHAPWRTFDKIKFLCPSPGYDRHFAITQELGFEMIPVRMTENGPDMDEVERLVADPAVKGIWCVPLYSNPQGICCGDDTVKRLGKMKCAAPDFKIFWDNAYGVHHLYGETPLYDIFKACEEGGNPERAYYFFSTSKITFPGGGVSIFATGYGEHDEILKHLGIQTISYDKLNQLRTLKFLKDKPTTMRHMEKMAALLRPKFDTVLDTLDNRVVSIPNSDVTAASVVNYSRNPLRRVD